MAETKTIDWGKIGKYALWGAVIIAVIFVFIKMSKPKATAAKPAVTVTQEV